jgi:hypothetical protein
MTDVTHAELGANDGASLVGFKQNLPGAVARTVEAKLQETVSIYDFMTTAEIADNEARTAITSFSTALNLTTAIQNAIYASYAAEQNLYCPAGAAKVTGLEFPTNEVGYDGNPDTWKMFGQGSAQTFARCLWRGTTFVSDSDAPILRYRLRRAQPSGSGNWDVSYIRFQQINAQSTAPVVLIDSMSEYATFPPQSDHDLWRGGRHPRRVSGEG